MRVTSFALTNFLNEPSVFAVDLILKRRFGSPLMFGHKTHSVACMYICVYIDLSFSALLPDKYFV